METTTRKHKPILGYRTMTGAQRYNARMERIMDECRDAKTRFNASSRTEDATPAPAPRIEVEATALSAAREWFVLRGERYPDEQPAIKELAAIISKHQSDSHQALVDALREVKRVLEAPTTTTSMPNTYKQVCAALKLAGE